MSDPNALPIAGWYPDPENESGDRWWNGATWSDHRRPRNAPAGWAPDASAAAPAKKRAPSKKAAAAAGAVAAADAGAAGAAAAAGAAPAAEGEPASESGAAASATPAVPVPPGAGPARPDPYAGTATQPAQPGYTPYAPAYAPNYAPVASTVRNPLALGGMITSLVALLCNFILFGAPGIAGAIVSFFGLRRANQLAKEGVTVGNGKAMAITGIVVGLIGALLWDLFYFSVFSPLSFS